MLLSNTPLNNEPERLKIQNYTYIDESIVLNELCPMATLEGGRLVKVTEQAHKLAEHVRSVAQEGSHVQNLLNQYSLSTNEGVVLMCLAEALLRVPDKITADRLIRDRLGSGDWQSHIGGSDSLFVNSSAWGLMISGKVVSFNDEQRAEHFNNLSKLVGSVGEPVIRSAMRMAMKIMGTQFVLGTTIQEAISKSEKMESKGYTYSYDMLGEAARTMVDADGYFDDYKNAIEQIGKTQNGKKNELTGNGISVKLSAIHPRYEYAQRDRVLDELVPRLKELAILAKHYNIGLTVDAEEANRLELSLDVIEAVFRDIELGDWQGFGIVVQAYQKRALPLLQWLVSLSKSVGRKMMVRLVKGAYWDTEIKHAQLEGLSGYPVYTRKASTDVSYQACAGFLLDNRKNIYPQFATHNAYSVAYVLERSNGESSGFEFQQLHGMGEGLYDSIVEDNKFPVRIYAPVGEHESLLAYLVRRLLENGANTSFVNNIVDDSIPLEDLIADPVKNVTGREDKKNPNIRLPIDIYGNDRSNSRGFEFNDIARMKILECNLSQWKKDNIKKDLDGVGDMLVSTNPANLKEIVGVAKRSKQDELDKIIDQSEKAHLIWSATEASQRADCLNRFADNLEAHMDELIAMCINEAGKITMDGIAEVREAVDFCRYYANQGIEISNQNNKLELNQQLMSRGPVVCISPWNFPLAIFTGQVVAALSAGNSVLAKPADSTCIIASRAIELMEDCGFPSNIVQMILIPGKTVGDNLLPDLRIKAVMFTGSTGVGSWIAKKLSQRSGPRVPLIAETGGQNCLLVDSTALPEQVVDDVISSGFQSAGQRCSGLRVLYLQEEVADNIIEMIVGAMKELTVGNPQSLRVDVGPVIDNKALDALNHHVDYMHDSGHLIYECQLSSECENGTFFAPKLYEIDDISVLKEEVFGPVVHIIRYKAEELNQAIESINSTGFGLTSGIHSRIDATCEKFTQRVNAGNIYINRNIIGAVVGVQPFGGHGLSGTGPKAGGPHYVPRLSVVNTTKDAQSKVRNIQSFINDQAPIKNLNTLLLKITAEKTKSNDFDLKNLIYEISSMNSISKQFEKETVSILEHEKSNCLTLVGPTGELNQLLYEARGTLLCIQQNSDYLEKSIIQVLSALVTGNKVIHLTEHNELLSVIMKKFGFGKTYRQIQIRTEGDIKTILHLKQLDGIAISGNQSFIESTDQLFMQRDGALKPVITETTGSNAVHRFVLEKSVSNNTTASGGNASLLAMGDG